MILNELKLRWKSLVDCIYCDIEMDLIPIEEVIDDMEITSFICPMCGTVASFCKGLEDSNEFVH